MERAGGTAAPRRHGRCLPSPARRGGSHRGRAGTGRRRRRPGRSAVSITVPCVSHRRSRSWRERRPCRLRLVRSRTRISSPGSIGSSAAMRVDATSNRRTVITLRSQPSSSAPQLSQASSVRARPGWGGGVAGRRRVVCGRTSPAPAVSRRGPRCAGCSLRAAPSGRDAVAGAQGGVRGEAVPRGVLARADPPPQLGGEGTPRSGRRGFPQVRTGHGCSLRRPCRTTSTTARLVYRWWGWTVRSTAQQAAASSPRGRDAGDVDSGRAGEQDLLAAAARRGPHDRRQPAAPRADVGLTKARPQSVLGRHAPEPGRQEAPQHGNDGAQRDGGRDCRKQNLERHGVPEPTRGGQERQLQRHRHTSRNGPGRRPAPSSRTSWSARARWPRSRRVTTRLRCGEAAGR